MNKARTATIQSQPLEAVARFIRGITFTPDDKVYPGTEGSTVCMRTANVQDVLDESDLIAVPLEFVKRDEQFLVESDILVSTANSWNLVGKCSWVPKLRYRATAGGFISILRADRSKVYPRYLYYWFASDQTQHEVRLCGRQTTNISNMSYERCLALEIPLPPLSEQKRIADILDTADAIRRKRQEAIDEFDKLLRSTFAQMFGDPNRNSMGWEVARLGAVATLDRGRSRHRPRDAKFLYGGPYPLVQTGDITNSNGFVRVHSQSYSEEGLAQSRLWPAGTLCITIAANIGKTAVLAFDACFPDSVVGLIVGSRLTTEYVRHWFVAVEKATDAAATQVAQKNINLEYLRNLAIQIPPIAKQQQFSAFLNAMRQTQEKAEIAMLSTDNLFNSLVQRAFKGEL